MAHAGRPEERNHRRLRGRAGIVRGYQRVVAYLRCAHAHLCRSESGDDRARRGQPRRRFLPGISDQQ
jgi:hypothetical protein